MPHKQWNVSPTSATGDGPSRAMNMTDSTSSDDVGSLATLLRLMKDEGLDIHTIGGAESDHEGWVTIVLKHEHDGNESPDPDAKMERLLERHRYLFVGVEAVEAALDDRPGALHELVQRLADGGVDILGIAVEDREGGQAIVTFATSDPETAKRIIGGQYVHGA